MKFLTIRQPWASLIAVGAKQIETRPFSTKYRVQCIHAKWRRSHLPCADIRPVRGGHGDGDGHWSEGSPSCMSTRPRRLSHTDDRQPGRTGNRPAASSCRCGGVGGRCYSWRSGRSPQRGQGRQRRREPLVAIVCDGALPPRRADIGSALQGRCSCSCFVGPMRAVWCSRWAATPGPQDRKPGAGERQKVRDRRRVVLALLSGAPRARAKAAEA